MINEDAAILNSGVRTLAEEAGYAHAETERRHRIRFLSEPMRQLQQDYILRSCVSGRSLLPPSAEVGPAKVSQYSATLPATGVGVLAARRLARAAALPSPRAHDVELVVCELASCAARVSADGEFTLTAVRHLCQGWLHVQAIRAEGDWPGAEDEELALRYGLMIVDSLADQWGSIGIRHADGRVSRTATTWAELSWT